VVKARPQWFSEKGKKEKKGEGGRCERADNSGKEGDDADLTIAPPFRKSDGFGSFTQKGGRKKGGGSWSEVTQLWRKGEEGNCFPHRLAARLDERDSSLA